jgi:hypothetical protein
VAASLNGRPSGSIPQIRKPVVLKKPHEARVREVHHGAERARPDGGRHRQQTVMAKALSQMLPLQRFPDRQSAETLPPKPVLTLPIEAQDVPNHAEERTAQWITAPSKQAVEAVSVVLQRGIAEGVVALGQPHLIMSSQQPSSRNSSNPDADGRYSLVFWHPDS